MNKYTIYSKMNMILILFIARLLHRSPGECYKQESEDILKETEAITSNGDS